MSSSRVADQAGETFHGLLLRLRGRTPLTQRQLALQLGVGMRSVQAWEAGDSFPNAETLQTLIARYLDLDGFAVGREAAEAAALWTAAEHESTRQRPPFDTRWFAELMNARAAPGEQAPGNNQGDTAELASTPSTATQRLQDWDDAPEALGLLGRVQERELLSQWILDDRSRLVALLGLGGIGKTVLAARIARQLAPEFERVYWHSVRAAPSLSDWLGGAIAFLSGQQQVAPEGDSPRLATLLDLLQRHRCLLVLDNLEVLFQAGDRDGSYLEGYASYGTLLEVVAGSEHHSCLLLTSREAPPELAVLAGAHGAVRRLELGGLSVADARQLLGDKRLQGDDADWGTLVTRYGGNGLALKVVAETINQVFGRQINAFLEQAGPGAFGGIRRLLDRQLERLSAMEQSVLQWLAVERDRVTFGDLVADLGPNIERGRVIEAVEGLRRRSLIEHSQPAAAFTLQSVILEYATDRLVDELADEIDRGPVKLLVSYALMKAHVKDDVRRSQERLLLLPLLDRLVARRGTQTAVEQRLLTLLAELRARPLDEHGYAPGNLVNLLRLIRGDLRGVDLSGLAIRQAYLQEVEAQDASLAGATVLEVVLAGAFNFPTSVALSHDGSYLAAGTSTGDVCLWRMSDRTLLATYPDQGLVLGVTFDKDGRLIVSGSREGPVIVRDAGSGGRLAIVSEQSTRTLCVALSRDGQLVASGDQDSTIQLWETATERRRTTLRGHTREVWGVALSSDAWLVASGSEDMTVRLWDAQNSRLLMTLQGHTGGVRSVALSDDGRVLASASLDGTVRVWATQSGRLLATLQGHTGGARCVALSGDGQLLASGSYDGTLRIWETHSASLPARFGSHRPHSASHRGVDESAEDVVRLWETETGRLLATLRGYSGEVRGVALSGDGRLLASGGDDGTVHVWDAVSGRLLARVAAHSGGIWSVALSEDSRVLASASDDGTVRLWESDSLRSTATLQGHAGGVWGVALNIDGRLVASGGADGRVRLWDPDGSRLLRTLEGHTSGVWRVVLSGDARVLASGSFDGTVRLWDVERGELRATLRGHTGGIWGVALNRNGSLVASGGADRFIRIWDAERGQLVATLEGHTGGVRSVALSVDGSLLASSSFDGTVRLWDTASGQLLTVLRGHTGLVYSAALSGDAQTVASGGVDGTVRLWDARTGQHLRTMRGDRRYERLDITALTGISEAQREALIALGAVDRARPSPVQRSS